MLDPLLDRPPGAVSLDRETLVARFDGIRLFARGGRRAPNKPLLLLYALARLKHDRLERHFAPGLHEEILEAVSLEVGTPVATCRRDMAFRAALLEASLAECCVCGFSLRVVDGWIVKSAASCLKPERSPCT